MLIINANSYFQSCLPRRVGPDQRLPRYPDLDQSLLGGFLPRTPFTLDPERWIRPGSDPATWINGQCERKKAGSDPVQDPAILIHLSRRVESGNWWIRSGKVDSKYKCKRKGGSDTAIRCGHFRFRYDIWRAFCFCFGGTSVAVYIFVCVFIVVSCCVHMDCACVKRFVVFSVLIHTSLRSELALLLYFVNSHLQNISTCMVVVIHIICCTVFSAFYLRIDNFSRSGAL